MPNGKYTPERVKRFCDAIELGGTIGHAAGYAGFCERAYYNWIKDALENPDTSKYRDLPGMVRDAEARGVVSNLARIQTAAKNGTWQAAAWTLERRYPEIYGRRTADVRVDATVRNVDAEVREAAAKLTDAQLGIPPNPGANAG